MKTILAAAVATMVVTSAGAGELKPLAGHSFAFGGVTGAAYYTVEADGFRVLATLSTSESGSPVRFVTTLDDGQSVTLAVPAFAGGRAGDVVITRKGESVNVTRSQAPDLRADVSFD